MKRLYNEYEALSPGEGTNLDEEAHLMLKPLVKLWADQGYSLRDIHLVISNCLSGLMAEAVLRAARSKFSKSREIK